MNRNLIPALAFVVYTIFLQSNVNCRKPPVDPISGVKLKESDIEYILLEKGYKLANINDAMQNYYNEQKVIKSKKGKKIITDQPEKKSKEAKPNVSEKKEEEDKKIEEDKIEEEKNKEAAIDKGEKEKEKIVEDVEKGEIKPEEKKEKPKEGSSNIIALIGGSLLALVALSAGVYFIFMR